MNRYLRILEFETYSRVQYYTIRFETDEDNETDKFLLEYEGHPVLKEDLDNMVDWLNEIGNYGATLDLFRKEDLAQALPPYPEHLEFGEAANLRLYCKRLSNTVVVLFGGAEKTAQYVKDCPNCKPHFDLAQIVCQQISDALSKGVLRLSIKKLNGFSNFRIQIK